MMGNIKLVCLLGKEHNLYYILWLTKAYVKCKIINLDSAMDESDILDVNQAAEMLGMSLSTFHRRVKTKHIAAGHRLGKGPMYWFRSEIEAYMDKKGMKRKYDKLLQRQEQ